MPDTPGIAPSPSVAEVTVPVMTFVCAHRVLAPANTNKTKNRNSFFIRLRFRLKFKWCNVGNFFFYISTQVKKNGGHYILIMYKYVRRTDLKVPEGGDYSAGGTNRRDDIRAKVHSGPGYRTRRARAVSRMGDTSVRKG